MILLVVAVLAHILLVVAGQPQERLAEAGDILTSLLPGKLGVTQPARECDLR